MGVFAMVLFYPAGLVNARQAGPKVPNVAVRVLCRGCTALVSLYAWTGQSCTARSSSVSTGPSPQLPRSTGQCGTPHSWAGR
ncbi:hypothetical protein GCM10027273_33190 [Nocardioides pakistanensis]